MVGVLEQNDCILEKYEKEIQLVNKKDDVEALYMFLPYNGKHNGLT